MESSYVWAGGHSNFGGSTLFNFYSFEDWVYKGLGYFALRRSVGLIGFGHRITKLGDASEREISF